MIRTLLATTALTLATATTGLALTLNFDGTDPAAVVSNSAGYNYKWAYDEITLQTTTANFNGYWIWGNIAQSGGNLNYAGTWDGRPQSMYLLPGTDGSASFDLNSIRIKNTAASADGITISGYTSGGVALRRDVASNGNFVDISFGSDWTDLTSAYVNVWYTGGNNGITTFEIDNLALNETVSAVPLPASILFLGAAVGGLAVTRRRNRPAA